VTVVKTALAAILLWSAAAGAPVLAQSAADTALYPDLPYGPRAPAHGVIPDVGATPGYSLYAVSLSALCSTDAGKAADGLMTPQTAVAVCNDAISLPIENPRERAGNHVNRGVLLVTMGQASDARRDFDRALEILPDLPEALVNRATMKIADGKAAEAVADLDKAIAAGVERPERAYYYRAMGREMQNNIRGAYEDYRMAQSLNPAWPEPGKELARFQVRPAQR
jgi:tetratricopeptide (TPR) repeat protein